jgi:hypothetical protein
MSPFRRNFCLCIPVRIGVFVTSLLVCLLAAIASAAAFYLTWGKSRRGFYKNRSAIQLYLSLVINNDPQRLVKNQITINFTKGWKIGIIVFGAVLALVSLMSFFG